MKMPALRKVLASAGLGDVETLQVAGNLVLDPGRRSSAAVAKAVRAAVREGFGFDLPGWDMPTTEKRIEIVKTMLDRGYEDQILLSQDTSIFTDWWPGLGNIPGLHPKEWRLEFIIEEVAPAMMKAGIPQRAIDKMLIDNPRRYLENNAAY